MIEYHKDTIAAIATPPGTAAVSMVRVSGPQAIEIADRVFRNRGPRPARRPGGTFCHGFVRSGAAAVQGSPAPDVDEAILLIFRAPHSYTREDVIEIQGHGGRACAERILRAVLDAGARPAEPGEFTRRAFLSGRVDLVQAEAVMDLISAQSDRAASSALEQLEGRLSNLLSMLYDNLISICSDLEASLDFSEDEIAPLSIHAALDAITGVSKDVAEVLSTWREGRRLREGARVVIAGRPNVGKSSLLNAILGWSRAIVTDIPGTTRDTIEETFVLHGYPIRLIDTAGLCDSDCVVEREGVSRAHEMLVKADLILYLLDANALPGTEEQQFVASLPPDRLIVVWNKMDLAAGEPRLGDGAGTQVRCSSKSGEGLVRIRAAMSERLGLMDDPHPHAAVSERHRKELVDALRELERAGDELRVQADLGVVPAAANLRLAAEAIGRIIGRSYSPDLLDRVFSRFCVGK